MQLRRLLLVRHAEAAPALADESRQLTGRGERQAASIGSELVRAGITPDRVVVSPARRARQTWDRASEPLGTGPRPVVAERIYDGTTEDLLAVIRETPEDVRTLVLVGHNPSVGELAALLAEDAWDGTAGFPAGTVAVFDVGTAFTGLEPGAATLVDVVTPPG